MPDIASTDRAGRGNCDPIDDDRPLLETDEPAVAREAAEAAPFSFGAGIRDTETRQLDVGFGCGGPCDS